MVEQLTEMLREQLALLQAAAGVLEESRTSPELLDTVGRILRYVGDKGYA